MTSSAHVSLITLGVEDLEAATAFYEALGWQRSGASQPGVVTFLRGGATVLGLFGHGDLAAESGVPVATGTPDTSVALATNLGSPEAVDRLLAAAEAAGGRITRPAARAEWGGYSGYVTDPDGHLWEIAHNPGFPLADDGTIRLSDETTPADRTSDTESDGTSATTDDGAGRS